MRDLDETDLDILRLLVEDARRPWADIAEAVDLSPPAVSDRVDRLQETGVVRRFTVDVDRSALHDGVPVLVELALDPSRVDAVRESARAASDVEHVFTTADGDLVCSVRVPDGDVPAWVAETFDDGAIRDYEVTLLTDAEWTPSVDGAEFAVDCAECGNTVTSEGVTARVGGELKQFCCPSCKARFEEGYERLEDGI